MSYTPQAPQENQTVQRDVGGYAVALASSMKHIFCGNAGETYFATFDAWLGRWSLLHRVWSFDAGMATIMYEGTPIRPDAGVWWSIVEKYKVTRMFSAPTRSA